MTTLAVPASLVSANAEQQIREEAWLVGALDLTFPSNLLPAGLENLRMAQLSRHPSLWWKEDNLHLDEVRESCLDTHSFEKKNDTSIIDLCGNVY